MTYIYLALLIMLAGVSVTFRSPFITVLVNLLSATLAVVAAYILGGST